MEFLDVTELLFAMLGAWVAFRWLLKVAKDIW